MSRRRVELGLRENLAQFSLLVVVNAFVGAMVGLERSTLPLIGREDFGLTSKAAVLSFIVAFGLAKALTNLAAGSLASSAGRRRLLIAGWAIALPVPLLIALAPSWEWIVAANVLLGINQGLAWSMTVAMKIDLVGPERRGLQQHAGDDRQLAPDTVGPVPRPDLPEPPDGRVHARNEPDLADAGAVRGEKQRDQAPRERVVEVVDQAGL